ncbi:MULTISPECIES: 23S rRNA (pseudouridine(1915)-N(3))-methyltransferase RlmH [unclassified Anaerobiospirillum]|uniref:23S rRNA (pseudouridine(1915)-N(3))-methyltransferase RlmH n=1 Tax=unclassified Anaerobiospirillum TaxID=2647410 RepID=UPI001FF3D65A|nr:MULTISPECIES: 23S rRNA (pseudouridine(1915)-N(3))-methyltransferase RlmH [unclassified Anaerobiospirillum]MCK0527182.1 23S rRNA (pseudouridine(1915)-N(3))-methyltransferase RlmH [Anaerobiospirillum sp. NML120449]MCK0535557.1 23S rRNA (pseudouridine(1915)-N(3))-methyltransferase RlmH [Anaerobiospirillum sp. NML120511]MCK0539509.1 23S rRNA (pseudouridine(1915)-N(3))-methyltransferase RlmH [Anaerobiospirillum sp. NML02-A-032]
MKFILLAVGTKMPAWITTGFTEYQKRMPPHMQLVLQEIEPVRRTGKSTSDKAREIEAKAILEALPKRAHVVALDEHGRQYTSMELADKIHDYQQLGSDVVIIIGGPEGLTREVLDRANETISLSKLTLPHPLVRVFIAETLYRAYSIDAGLPYHRA